MTYSIKKPHHFGMPKMKSTSKKVSKTVVVREHSRRVPISKKNPTGRTLVDRHLRHIEGQYLDLKMIYEVVETYEKKNLIYPSANKLKIPDEDKYSELIAVWVDYFNKKFKFKEPIDPDLIKALIASESTFNPNAINKEATGLTQITTETLKILQNLEGEAKDFVFKDIRKKDLKDPNVAVALGVRWIAYKKSYAEKVLKRPASSDEVIKVYKGILKDKSENAKLIMETYRTYYDKIKK